AVALASLHAALPILETLALGLLSADGGARRASGRGAFRRARAGARAGAGAQARRRLQAGRRRGLALLRVLQPDGLHRGGPGPGERRLAQRPAPVRQEAAGAVSRRWRERERLAATRRPLCGDKTEVM